jgi:lysophospholipase L1-like esterase
MATKITLFIMFIAAMFLMSFRHNRKRKVIFFGDSITEQGAKPGGYIKLMELLVKQDGLEDNFFLQGAGVSGNKIYDLYLRLEEDIMQHSPAIVVIYIGINDIWHKSLLGTGTDIETFGKFYEKLVTKLQAANIKVVICTPTLIGENKNDSNPLNEELDEFSNWIRNFATKNNLPIVDLRKAFIQYNFEHNIENVEAGILTTDTVHLNAKGNELVAKHIWTVLKEVK